MISEIESGLIEFFKSIDGIKAIYDHEPKILQKVPAITLVFTGFNNSDGGTFNSDEYTTPWDFRLYVSIGQDPEKSFKQLKDLTDAMLKQYAGCDASLGGACTSFKISTGQTGEILDQNNPMFVLNGRIEAIASINY